MGGAGYTHGLHWEGLVSVHNLIVDRISAYVYFRNDVIGIFVMFSFQKQSILESSRAIPYRGYSVSCTNQCKNSCRAE